MCQFTKPFQDALYIIEKIEQAGHQAYFVGGCVRDLLLKRSIGDIDITTSATPDKIQTIFDQVIPVGIEHGTVIVRHNKVSYEVTTFRVESDYSDGRHPDSVQFIDKIDQDLARRDFTVNALAMDKYGKIIDLFHGQEDLQNGLLRTVGDGMDRLKEDPLRILRAIRFSSQLGFKIENDTLSAIRDVKPAVEGLAVERITAELQKLFAGNYVKAGLIYLTDLRIEKHLPVLKDYQVLKKLSETIRPVHTLSEVICLIHRTEPKMDVRTISKGWKCSNRVLNEAIQLNEAITYYTINGLNNMLAYKLLPDFYMAFSRITEILFSQKVKEEELIKLRKNLVILSKKDLDIDGNDIIKLFPDKKKGPWIQELLIKMEELVIQGNIENKKTILKDWIKWNPPVVK
ncbi:CCA tRNA nucleotidyltransferase [Paucisalibacillus globulus]|uniref:CCA tRNA nucleotidyltransferase n=1 Tax=Paucisalibacillus globulus TaxID=351095 RepID=UPI0004029FCC|nr:CCA tRNA nucleotidyltransferase [Paucisalibacillus globulus]